jgi:hypothetical protein
VSALVIARATCRFCGLTIELTEAPDARWSTGPYPGVSGRNPECPKAPNPSEGPMPDHEPGDVIAWRDQQPPPPPAAPYTTPSVPWIPASVPAAPLGPIPRHDFVRPTNPDGGHSDRRCPECGLDSANPVHR